MSTPPRDPTKALRGIESRDQGARPRPTTNVQDGSQSDRTQRSPADLWAEPSPRHFAPTFPDLLQQRPEIDRPFGIQPPEICPAQSQSYNLDEKEGLGHTPSPLPCATMSNLAVASSSRDTTSGPSSAETQSVGSSKSQRKPKNHVVSACVPCKRAHLKYVSPHLRKLLLTSHRCDGMLLDFSPAFLLLISMPLHRRFFRYGSQQFAERYIGWFSTYMREQDFLKSACDSRCGRIEN